MEEHCTLKSLAENYPQFVPYQQDPAQEEDFFWLVSQGFRTSEGILGGHYGKIPRGGAFVYDDVRTNDTAAVPVSEDMYD